MTYLYNALLALDIFGSELTGGLPGETISGRAGNALREGRLSGRVLVPAINFVMRDSNHCQEAVLGDIVRAKAVIVDETASKLPSEEAK